mmetsp:Transcript_15235/g.31983  ORF Transcript_15235/g.31983 Transcript_15235/m.31983 type:complete len:557 (-) Transcript_15235:70-1740(-)
MCSWGPHQGRLGRTPSTSAICPDGQDEGVLPQASEQRRYEAEALLSEEAMPALGTSQERRLRSFGLLAAAAAMLLLALASGYGSQPPAAGISAAATERGAVQLASLEAEEEEEGEEGYWEVSFEGAAQIRESKDVASVNLGEKWKCTIVHARRQGDWLELIGDKEGGYLKISVDGETQLKQMPVYQKISKGSCADINWHPISDSDFCTTAAEALGLKDTTVDEVKHRHGDDAPDGCFWNSKNHSLWLSNRPASHGHGADKDRQLLCSTYAGPPEKCHPVTFTSTTTTATTVTTTTTTTVWGTPSLFCYEIVSARGPEPDLARTQLAKRASIFRCDEYTIFSVGGAVDLGGGWIIPEIKSPKGSTGTAPAAITPEIMMQAWDQVKWDGRYAKHDWVVKVNVDAVFFAERLRSVVARHTAAPGAEYGVYILNCNRFPDSPSAPPKLLGVVEVFSRGAMQAYMKGSDRCKKELEWQGWGEDLFMQNCMDLLGVGHAYEFGMLADRHCWTAPCSDTSRVAFGGFRDVTGYGGCWDTAFGAEDHSIAEKPTLRPVQELLIG